MTDLDRLLASVVANADALPGAEVIKVPLEQVLAEMRSISVRRLGVPRKKSGGEGFPASGKGAEKVQSLPPVAPESEGGANGQA